MLVQKTGNSPSELRRLQQLAHGAGIVEELSLQLSRQGIPLHNQGSAETSQDLLLVLGKRDAVVLIMLSAANGVLMIVGEPLLIVGERDEALFPLPKLTLLIGIGRGLHQTAVLGGLVAIPLGREHAASLPWKSAMPTGLLGEASYIWGWRGRR